MTANYPLVDSVESFEKALAQVRAAQKTFATYTQEQVDISSRPRPSPPTRPVSPWPKMAVEETGMGVVEDKVIKNHYAAEYIYNAYKHTKTCGVIEEDPAYGIKKIAGAHRRHRRGDPHHQPHLHRHLQDADGPEDPQRHHHQPPPPGQGLHHRRRQDRAGGRGGRRRPRGHHRLD